MSVVRDSVISTKGKLMKTFSIAYLATCIAFADVFFPYTAWALGAWVVVALVTMRVVATR